MNKQELSRIIEDMKDYSLEDVEIMADLQSDLYGEALAQLVKIFIWKKVSFNAWSEDTERFLMNEAATITADAWITAATDERRFEESAFTTTARAINKAIMRTVRAERKEKASRAAITETTDDDGNTIEIINMIEDQRNLSTASAAIIAADAEIIAREHASKYNTTPEAMQHYIICRIEGIRPTSAGKESGMTRRQGINAEDTWRDYTRE